MTIETTRMNNEEITNQVSRRLNEIKDSLNVQIQDAIATAITNKVLPSIQNTLETRGRANYTVVDRESCGPPENSRTNNFTAVNHRSSGLQRNSEVENIQKTWENCPRRCFSRENHRQMSRESSVNSYTGDQNRDNY